MANIIVNYVLLQSFVLWSVCHDTKGRDEKNATWFEADVFIGRFVLPRIRNSACNMTARFQPVTMQAPGPRLRVPNQGRWRIPLGKWGMVSLEKVLESSSSICFTIAALSYPPDTSIYYFWSSIFLTVASTLYHTFDHVYPSKEHRPIAEFFDSVAIINLCAFTLTLSPTASILTVTFLLLFRLRTTGKYVIYALSFFNTAYMAYQFSALHMAAVVFEVMGSFIFFETQSSLLPINLPFRWNCWTVWGHCTSGLMRCAYPKVQNSWLNLILKVRPSPVSSKILSGSTDTRDRLIFQQLRTSYSC
ncbi:hypothetical protein AAMO2058_001108000 [Amorphochlora amoebiformis]